MTDDRNGPAQAAPWHLWAVGLAALLWNGLGVALWAGTSFMAESFLGGLPADHRAYVLGLPAWSTLTWGLGVLGGAAGAILLVLRSRLAVPAFAASLAGAVANTMVYVANPPPAGFFNLPLTLFIIGFALFLLCYAWMMGRRGVI